MINKIPSNCVRSWVLRYFPDHKFRKGDEQIRINNPFVPDRSYNLEINTKLLCVNDFRGLSWVGINPNTGKRQKCTFLRFVQLYLTKIRGTCSYRAAAEDVMGSASSASAILAGYAPKVEEVEEAEITPPDLPSGSKPIDLTNIDVVQRHAVNYLHRRHITDDKIAKYQMMSAGLQVVWPYFEFEELCYYQARSTTNKRFEFPAGTQKGQYLYGFDLVEPASYLIITEAIIDSQTLDAQCVATGGCSMTANQVKKIKLIGPRDGIILAPDNDVAGIKSVLGNAKLLEPVFGRVYYAMPPKIVYHDDGQEKYTKDWNDIAVYTEEDPMTLLHQNTQPLGITQKVKLLDLLAGG